MMSRSGSTRSLAGNAAPGKLKPLSILNETPATKIKMAAHIGFDVGVFKVEKYPKEIASNLRVFHNTLNEVEKVLSSLKKASLGDVHTKLDALDRAKLELVSAYAINSMFWMYLCTQGVNPREHPIKHELGRIQKYMSRVSEIADKEKAAKLDKGAAKRFVNAALYEPEATKSAKGKRKAADDAESGPSKKR